MRKLLPPLLQKKPHKGKTASKPLNTLIVLGLGNPGKAYDKTRHNAGFLVVEELAERLGLKLSKPFFRSWRAAHTQIQGTEGPFKLVLAEPLTYMNASGDVVPDLFQRYKAGSHDLVVVCDSLDLPPGTIRVKGKGSSAGQKGLSSIINSVGTREFRRIFIGIGRPEDKEEVISWVLSKPGNQDFPDFYRGVQRAADAILEMTRVSLDRVMNKFNGTAQE